MAEMTTDVREPLIRAAETADLDAIAAIFEQGRAATFTGMDRTTDGVLVAEQDGRIAGFARAIPSGDRCAQAGVGEYAVYLDRDARGRGLGRALLTALVAEAADAGYWKLVGKMFTTNAASIALARSCGFREVGVHERHGRLDGEWKDVLLVERLIG